MRVCRVPLRVVSRGRNKVKRPRDDGARRQEEGYCVLLVDLHHGEVINLRRRV